MKLSDNFTSKETAMRLLSLLLAVSAVYGDEKSKLTLESLAKWQQHWGYNLEKTRNPLAKAELAKKKQEEYNTLIRGKPIEGVGSVFGIVHEARTGKVQVTVAIKLPKILDKPRKTGPLTKHPTVTYTFIVLVEDGNDPFLKTINKAFRKTEASKVHVSGILDDHPNGNRILKGKIKSAE